MGGYFGVNMTRAKTHFYISKSVVSPGNEITVKVDADNSECNISIKSFKFKLWRRTTFKFNGEYIEYGEFLSNVKLPGCKPKE